MGWSQIRALLLIFAVLAFGLLAGGCTSCRIPRIDPTGDHFFICTPVNLQLPKCQLPSIITNPSASFSRMCSGCSFPKIFQSCGQRPGGCRPPCRPLGKCLDAGAQPSNFHDFFRDLCHKHLGTKQAQPKYYGEPGPPGYSSLSGVCLSPTQVFAPVGAEVVMKATVCDRKGYMLANQRVEWTLATGGVGQFVSIGQRAGLDWLINRTTPHKVTSTYAIGTTSSRDICLTRGTPTTSDDVPVRKGQAWLTVSSPVEGTSHVAAYVPEVYGWDSHQQSATIYWVDARWSFPPAAINPVGTRHVFTTSVTKTSNCAPLINWRVRYEITGGPPAGFAPDGATTIEVPTDTAGQARAEIFQKTPSNGTNTVSIQVIRPAELAGLDGTRLVVATGGTQMTWTAPQISLRKTGPVQGSVGATLTYRLEVRNPGDSIAREVVVNDPVPEGLTYVSSAPAATTPAAGAGAAPGGTIEWRLGDLQAGQTRVIEANFRADKVGTVNNCATVRTLEGITAQSCATTTVVLPTVDVTVTGPAQANVGDQVTFTADIVNRGGIPASKLVVVDRFDAGLKHPASASPIERDLGDLQPGQSKRITVTFQAITPGQQCTTVDVVGDGGLKATSRACVNVVGAAAPPVAAPPVTPVPPTAAGPKPVLSVRKSGPATAMVGDTADFTIDITNTGTVAANNLKIADNYDLSLDPVSATDGHAFAGDDVIWIVDTLPPGKTIRLQINCKCVTAAPKSCNRVTVTCQEGVRGDSEACLAIQGVAMPLTVTVADLRDPVAVGNESTYQIQVINGGDAPDQQVQLSVTFPSQMTPSAVGTSGPAAYNIQGQTVQFQPVATIRARETLTFQVMARATQAGSALVQAGVSSTNSPQVISAQQTTTVIANAP
jgi:uncharacterized repeat protein (TIGR01451 family)